MQCFFVFLQTKQHFNAWASFIAGYIAMPAGGSKGLS